MKQNLVAALALLLVACGTSAPSEPEQIKIGYIGPLTGDAASYGVDTVNGVIMAVDEINAAGGIGGHQVRLIAEDGRCSGTDSASAAQKLVNIDNVIAIIGGQCSGETLAAAPIAEAAGIPMISPVSSSPDVTDAGDFIFRVYPSDALKTKAMAKYLKERELTKVATISENTDFAIAFRNALRENMEEGSLVFDEVVEPNTKDFRTLFTRLQKEEFDIFFPNAQSPATMALMITQLREAGLEQQMITHDVGDSLTLIDLAPEAIEDLHVINVPSAGENGDFLQKFTEKFGNPPSTLAFSAHSYDATMTLFDAIISAGTEGSAIRDALYALEGHEGVVGTFSFDENGDVIGIPYVLKEFKNGQIVTIENIAVDGVTDY